MDRRGFAGRLILVLFVAALPATAQIGVSPPIVELELGDRPVTETIRLHNYGTKTVEVEASVIHWDLDEANNVRVLPPHEQSLDQWLVINPLRFTIEPGRSQAVRFAVRPKVRPEPGEHRAMINFNQVRSKASTEEFRVNFSLGVAVYAVVGESLRSGSVAEFGVKGNALTYEVASLGNASVRVLGAYGIWPAGSAVDPAAMSVVVGEPDTPAGALSFHRFPTTPVLPGTERAFSVPLPEGLPAGEYVLAYKAKIGDETVSNLMRFTKVDPGSVPPAQTAQAQ